MTNQDDVHRAFIYFHCRDDWHYQFLAGDLKTPLPLNYHFTSSNMVAEPVKWRRRYGPREPVDAVSGYHERKREIFLKLTPEK